MALLSTNDYLPRAVGVSLARSRELKLGKAIAVLVTAIDSQERGALVTLRTVFGFRLDTAALILHGVDPTTFRPDPALAISRCAFCGLDLRDAFDEVVISVSPPRHREIHQRLAHAACLNEALGRGSKIDFFSGVSDEPEGQIYESESGNASDAEFQQVLERVIDSEKLDFGDFAAIRLANTETAPNDATIIIDADYYVDDRQLEEILLP